MKLLPTTVTSYSGYYDNHIRKPYTTVEFGRESFERSVARALAVPGRKHVRAIMRGLNGVAPGAAWSVTNRRAALTSGNLVHGTVVGVETVTRSGTTTTAQRDEINKFIYDQVADNQAPAFYPADLSGNGGGGKLGY